MNRIDFEDHSYPMNLKRNGDGYANAKTQERYLGWCAALEANANSRKWRRKVLIFRSVKFVLFSLIAAAVAAEGYAIVHFAVKYW